MLLVAAVFALPKFLRGVDEEDEDRLRLACDVSSRTVLRMSSTSEEVSGG